MIYKLTKKAATERQNIIGGERLASVPARMLTLPAATAAAAAVDTTINARLTDKRSLRQRGQNPPGPDSFNRPSDTMKIRQTSTRQQAGQKRNGMEELGPRGRR